MLFIEIECKTQLFLSFSRQIVTKKSLLHATIFYASLSQIANFYFWCYCFEGSEGRVRDPSNPLYIPYLFWINAENQYRGNSPIFVSFFRVPIPIILYKIPSVFISISCHGSLHIPINSLRYREEFIDFKEEQSCLKLYDNTIDICSGEFSSVYLYLSPKSIGPLSEFFRKYTLANEP